MMYEGSHQNVDFLESRQIFHKRKQTKLSEVVHNLFNKKFKYRINQLWQLPHPTTWFSALPWKVNELEQLKSRLNFYKSQLNDYSIEEWSTHTRRRNPAGEVCWKVRNLVNPEFLTQAWTKFYECASAYSIIPNEAILDKHMVSLHLCEAPGAFITSLNHYLKSHHEDIEWKWLATTLNPYYEGNSLSNMISDDRFMFHTLDNWEFGTDNTGNLMDWKNSQAVIKRAKTLGKVLLVTADGSIDCLQKPDAQEDYTSPLHYCEIITALQALSGGGTLVMKFFTMFEHTTVNLLYLLTNLFTDVNIYKPVTSRQGNSEVYAICLHYSGSEMLESHIPVLKQAYGSEIYGNLSLFPLEAIPRAFIEQIEECALYFSSLQCQVISDNLHAYLTQNSSKESTYMKKLRSIVASEYLHKYDIRPLSYDHEILKGVLHEDHKINTNLRYHRGSYTQRELYNELSSSEKIEHLKSVLQADVLSNPVIFIQDEILLINNYDECLDVKISFTYGKPVSRVNSSKFIFVPIFKLYQQIMEEEEFKEIILKNKEMEVNLKECDNLFGLGAINEILMLPLFDFNDDYYIYEKRNFRILANFLKKLSDGQSVVIQNFTLLTHFNVSLLFLLSKKCFQNVGFTSDRKVILKDLQSKTMMNSYLDIIESEYSKLKGNTKDILSSLPFQMTNKGDFFNCVVFYNNTFYRTKCLQYLDQIETNICE